MSEINQQLITEAIDHVTSMDLDDCAFTEAFNAELRSMNGVRYDEHWNGETLQ